MLNGVLVTFLVDTQVFDWTASQMGVLIGIPVLTGSPSIPWRAPSDGDFAIGERLR